MTLRLVENGDVEIAPFKPLQTLKRLFDKLEASGFPDPYEVYELGEDQLKVIQWIAHNLVIQRRLGDFKLLVLGLSRCQKTLLMLLIAEFITVHFLPAKLFFWGLK
jgi:hypothetical protein